MKKKELRYFEASGTAPLMAECHISDERNCYVHWKLETLRTVSTLCACSRYSVWVMGEQWRNSAQEVHDDDDDDDDEAVM